MRFLRFANLVLAFALLASAAPRARAQLPAQQARPWLGVSIEAGAHGVVVKDVIPGTPAEAAGLAKGDEILAVDAGVVKKPEELIAAVLAKGVGTEVTVRFTRAGAPQEKKIKLEARPDELALLRSRLDGKPAPAIDLALVHGKGPASLAAAKGKVVVVEFWATWCPACVASHPRLDAFQRKHGDKVVVMTVAAEEEAPLAAYVKAKSPAFTVLRDATGAVSTAWMVTGIPQLNVVDKDGVVRFSTIGAGRNLEEALGAAEKLLN